MVFRSAYSRPSMEDVSPSGGSRIAPVFQEITNDDGVREVVQIGVTDVQDYIQASFEDTLIYNVLARVASGDTSLLNQVAGEYLDLTDLPKNIHEASRLVNQSEQFFSSLPADVRKEFHNDFHEFLAAAGTGRAEEVLSKFKPPEATPSEGVLPVAPASPVVTSATEMPVLPGK